MIVSNSINQMFEEMKAWRQELHSIPEIGLEEYETSKYIKSKLSEFNIEFKGGYANTGIVARVKGSQGESDKSIGLRADFDALPMPEKNEFEHKSTNEGMMHACGHDGHTSMLLGAAKYLSENTFPKKIDQLHMVAAPFEREWWGSESLASFGINDFENLKTIANKAEKIFLYHSKDDFVVPYVHAEKYLEYLPSAQLQTFEDR